VPANVIQLSDHHPYRFRASELTDLVGGVFTRALVYARLLSWMDTTTYKDDRGRPYVVPKLMQWAADYQVNRATITKHVQWLTQHGFLRVERVRIGRSGRLKIWVLARPKETSGNMKSTSRQHESNIIGVKGDKESKGDSIGVTPERANAFGVTEMILNKKLSGVSDRLKQKQEVSYARARARPPAPKTLAYEWNRLLRDYGYKSFEIDGKTLAHIKKTVRLFDCKGTAAFLEKLEYRIGRWVDIRPKTLGKAPPHPWAINRTYELVIEPGALLPSDEFNELEFTDDQKAAMANPIVQEAVDMSLNKGDKGPQESYKPEPWKPGSKWIKDKKE